MNKRYNATTMNIPELETMLGNYLKEQITAIEDAISKKDDIKIKQLAHKIKGNSGSIAIEKIDVNELGKKIELASDNFETVQTLLAELSLIAKSLLKES